MKRCERVLKRIFVLLLTVVLVCTTVDLSSFAVYAEESAILEAGTESVILETVIENVGGEATVHEEEREGIIIVEDAEVQSYVSDVELPGNEDLFAGYVDKVFYGGDATYGGVSTFGVAAREQLSTDAAKAFYDYLKTQITAVANGSQASTRFTFDASNFGAKVSFTAEDLGVDALVVNGSISQEVVNAASKAFWGQFEMSVLNDALLHDCPYELYWYDKVTGVGWGSSMSASYTELTITNPYIRFCVAGTYQAEGYTKDAPAVDTTITAATTTAVSNANAIVTEYSGEFDYEKLIGYRDEICELVTYDHDAAESSNFSENDNPWQLIYVFDGDTSTNVVCEGYAKAFQYLCDQTDFAYDISCYTVSGVMSGGTGSGGHMWNTVTMEDGKHYLVDVTNSDSGTVGQNGGLFLAGTSGSIAGGYTFAVGYSNIKFTYYEDIISLWGSGADSILTLADSDYEYVPGAVLPVCDVHQIGTDGTCSKCGGKMVIGELEDYVYSGYEIAPLISAKWVDASSNEKVLSEGVDFDVRYSNNVNAGTATVVITGIGMFSGSLNLTFEILCKDLGDEDIVSKDLSTTYNGTTNNPSVTVKHGDNTLIPDKDYTVKYPVTDVLGTYTITIIGKGNYKGTKSIAYTISPAPLTIKADDVYAVVGSALPEFTCTVTGLVDGETEEVLAKTPSISCPTADMNTVGTYTIEIQGDDADGNYSIQYENGTLTVKEKTDVSEQIELTAETVTYGNEPNVTAKFAGNGTFTYAYSNDEGATYKNLDELKDDNGFLPVGGYQVKVNYEDGTLTGEKTVCFEIVPKAVEVTADNASRKYKEANPVFTFTVPEGALVGMDTKESLMVTLTTAATVTSPVKESGYPITGTSTSTNYDVNVVPGVLTIEKAEAQINVIEGKETYNVSYGAANFSLLDGMELIGEGTPVYAVSDGMGTDGQPKAEEEIVTVSENGMVTIVGSGSVTVSVSMAATRNYTAAESKNVTILVAPMKDDDGRKNGFFIDDIGELTYTGKAIKPEPDVYDGVTGILLQKGKDYTFTYKNNTKAYILTEGEAGFDAKKAPTLIIKGKGNYSSTISYYFTIQQKDISDLADASITVTEMVLEANGKVQKKVPSMTYNTKKLSGILKPADGSTPAKIKDFIYSYPELDIEDTKDKAFKENGTWKILVEGTGNYTGSRYVNLTITDKGTNLAKATIKRIPAQEFDGVNAVVLDETALVVTAKVNGVKTELVKDIHYEVHYENNTGIGTATVMVTGKEGSGFAGTKKATFKITGTSIAKAKVEGLVNKVYDGSEQTQDLNLTLVKKTGTGKNAVTEEIPLTEGAHFTVTYDKNVNVGTAKVTIKGMGIYTGTIKKTFKITPYDMTGETDAEGNVKEESLLTEANGLFEMADGELQVKYVKGGCKPEVTLVFNGEELTAGKDYAVSYKNNKNVYTLTEGDEGYSAKKAPTITIKGKGNFKGTVTKTFVITGRGLQDTELGVTMTVADKTVSNKKGGYISKPVLTDKDGKVLKQGKDYTAPIYTMENENGETIILTKQDKVDAGAVITVSVTGVGAYADESEEPLSTTYRITEKNFGSVKVEGIQKEFTGSEIELTAADFLNEDGSSKITFKSKANKVELTYGEDYEIVEGSYKNNTKKGTASVILRGKGEYGGTKTIKFKIKAKGLFWWFD